MMIIGQVSISATQPKLPDRIGVVGLGYVGLQVAVAFSRVFPTIGVDIDHRRIDELLARRDRNGDVSSNDLASSTMTLSKDVGALKGATFLIVTVPTPVDQSKRPDLSHLVSASELVGSVLTRGCVVVYESTVYPGATEEVCIPVLERRSGLKAGRDFWVGYSPERINPGDADHTLESVVKIVAAQDQYSATLIAEVYRKVCRAGVHVARDIRTAEAAKAIENIQRDLNIALMNELAVIFNKLGLNTREVLTAAGTKWNFLPFEPGLVGGHCIPVDPYYMTHKAEEVGYHPEVILAGRRVNDEMGRFVARQAIKMLISTGKIVQGARALVLGLTFKENVRDVRNSRVFDVIEELESYGVKVSVHDPIVRLEGFANRAIEDPFDDGQRRYDVIILAVPHAYYRRFPAESFTRLLNTEGGPGVLVDIRAVLPASALQVEDVLYWRL